jgi:hypothetical protein
MTKAIVDRDVFGIQPNQLIAFQVAPPPRRAYQFLRTDAKVDEFMKWLKSQEDIGFLSLVRRPGGRPGIESAWSDIYIQSSYQQGIARARQELRRAGLAVPSFEQQPGAISGIFNQPFHADRVGMIYTRTFESIKSVSEQVNANVRRSLSDALTSGLARGAVEGKNPRTIAREIAKDLKEIVQKHGMRRVKLIARTEVIRAHHEANIAEYEDAQKYLAPNETIWADWLLGANPCPICIDLEAGAPYELQKIRGMIPAHPNCVCVAVPIILKKGEVPKPRGRRRRPPARPRPRPPAPPRPPVPPVPVPARPPVPAPRPPAGRRGFAPTTPLEFTPAATIDDAIEFITRNGFADEVSFDVPAWARKVEVTRRTPGGGITTGNMVPEFGSAMPMEDRLITLNGYAKQVVEMRNNGWELPKLRTLFMRESYEYGGWHWRCVPGTANARHAGTRSYMTLVPDHHAKSMRKGGAARTNAMMNKRRITGEQDRTGIRWSQDAHDTGDYLSYAVRHEYGHALDSAWDIRNSGAWRDIELALEHRALDKLGARDWATVRQWIKEEVSQYATTNVKELIAETFAHATSTTFNYTDIQVGFRNLYEGIRRMRMAGMHQRDVTLALTSQNLWKSAISSVGGASIDYPAEIVRRIR